MIPMNIKKLDKKQISYISIFVVLTGVLVWAFVSAGVITHNFNRAQVDSGERQALDISGIILTETKEGQKYWEIYGEKGHYTSDNEVAMLENVIGNFYKENEVSMSFESSKGTYNSNKKQIILYNDTHIVINDGTTMYADRLVWSGSDEDIIAQGNVKIIRGHDLVSTADKAIISPDYSKFRIEGQSTSKLYDSKKEKGK